MVVLETAGPWDADDLKELIHLMAPVKESVAGQDWGMLLVLKEDAFLLSDTVGQFSISVKKDQLIGRKATAIVLDKSVGYEMSKSLFDRVFNSANEPHAFFSNKTDATDWLRNKVPAH